MSWGNRRRVEGVRSRDLVSQVRRILPAMIGAVTFVGLVGCLLVAVYYLSDTVDFRRLTVDPVAEVGLPGYTGIVSHVGVLMWWSAATVCFFSATLLRRVPAAQDLSRLLLFLGIFSVVLGLDDLFLLHEEIGLWLSGFLLTDHESARQILEAPVFAVYAIAALFCVLRFWRTILKTEFLLLLAALASLGLSVSLDIGFYLFPEIAQGQRRREVVADAVEDLLKLQGITLWLIYMVRTGYSALRCGMHSMRQYESATDTVHS